MTVHRRTLKNKNKKKGGGGEKKRHHLQLISYAPGVFHRRDDQYQLHMGIFHQLCKSYHD